MKNITFTADERLLEMAHSKAKKQHTSLDIEFRHWLEQYVYSNADGAKTTSEFRVLMKEMRQHVKTGKKFSRDEMNER